MVSVLYYAHLCMKYSLGISIIFFKRSLVFPILLFSSVSLHCSFKKAFLSFLDILWNSAFSWVDIFPFISCLSLLLFHQLFLNHPYTTTLPSCIYFSWGWFWSLTAVQCFQPLSIVPQVLRLSDLTPWIYSSPPGYNKKGFDLGHTWMA